jgi:hypothetical protein
MFVGFRNRSDFVSGARSVDVAVIFSDVVGQYAHFFDRPEARLRFINTTLAQQSTLKERIDRTLGRFALTRESRFCRRLSKGVLELWLHRVILNELKQHLPDISKARLKQLRSTNAPFGARLFFRCYQFRRLIWILGGITAMASLFGLYSLATWSTHRVGSYLAERDKAQPHQTAGSGLVPSVYAESNPTYLPDYHPDKVWLVEGKDNFERYSNGGRVLTDYEVDNHPRAYYVFEHGKAEPASEARHAPVGIVYHTSESDLMSFTPDNNQSIEAHTRGLLEYVRKNKSYNYVIDRFGEVHRVVSDEDAANHAGNSVWADQKSVYVGLNESFIGVCFETQTDARTEQLTEAQVIAGRLLTQILRSRYGIDDANCVTHGLVSVNPGNMLICFHRDWVRNFPFDAMGLSDKYKVAPVSISEYGFTYDEEIVRLVGGQIWPGAASAREEVEGRAQQAHQSSEEFHRSMRNRYRDQLQLSRGLRVTLNEAE